MSVSFRDFIGAKGDGGGGDNWSFKTFKTPVKMSPPTNQLPVIFQAGCPSCRPTNSVNTLKEGKFFTTKIIISFLATEIILKKKQCLPLVILDKNR